MENDDANARRMAAKALENGSGPWLSQAYWVAGLAAWRQNDCQAAASAFVNVAARADNDDIRAGGLFWAARSYISCGNAPKVRSEAQTSELQSPMRSSYAVFCLQN